jgi:sulfide:quinone oxidoreductase
MDSRTHVVIAGAGVAGLETALALNALAREYVSIELISPEENFTYRPLAVTEPFHVGEVRRFPLARLVDAAGAQLRLGALVSVEPANKRVLLDDGGSVPYDTLVLALGARPREALPGALTFRGQEDRTALEGLLGRATAGELQRLVFVVPDGATWPLPLYELALLAAEYLSEHLTRGVEVMLVTPEQQPLALFGPQASRAIAELLELRGIRTQTNAVARSFAGGILQLEDGGEIAADGVVALPVLEGPSIDGIPQDSAGFVPTDELGWVLGLTDVYAAGDLSQSEVKQGGLAAQQADVVASAIAGDAGAGVKPAPYRPVLRGLLLTGLTPRFLRHEGGTTPSVVETQPLWWPPAKIVGRYLSPFLAEQLGLPKSLDKPPEAALPVEVALDTRDHAAWSAV